MTNQGALKSTKALEGLHAVHVVSHSPFISEEIKDGELAQATCKRSAIESNQRLIMQNVWKQRPAFLRPVYCSVSGDKTFAETVANVLTSLPFVVLGLQAPRRNLKCRLYANSLIGVGVASSMYHASRGKTRKYLRWADHTMIATATMCLSRALRDENPKFLMVASGILLPIQPLTVSVVNAGMMEVCFARRALKDPELKITHNVHAMSLLVAGALFIADEHFPQTSYIHAGWHLAAAAAVSTWNKLLE